MRMDLGRKLHFPQVIQISLRPDMAIWSEEVKKIILIGLTVLWKEGCVEVSERKATKYQDHPTMHGQRVAGLAIPS